tara:strand:+ start:190 stop:744 length:555 start_codon:yes stop_codon:yes gene_type:complete
MSHNNILMIHEFKKSFLNLPLEDYTLTFDDGLYTQYKFFNKIKNIKTKKYFFISSGIVCPEDVEQSDEFITCAQAHKKAFKGDFSNYMKWSQINEINKTENCFIGCHSHFHMRKTADCVECIISDNRYMLNDFSKHLGKIPDIFCFPYNKETGLYKEILFKKGFTEFFGDKRINIDDILYEKCN